MIPCENASLNCDNCVDCTTCAYCDDCYNCTDCVSCKDCIDCTDCFECVGCDGLVKKRYCIDNVQYTASEFYLRS